MKINKLYDYKKLDKEEDSTGARLYKVGKKKLPSVTTILSKTKDMTSLNKWKKRVGTTEAARITTEAASIGTTLHSNLENFILENKNPEGTLQVKLMTQLIIKKGLVNVNEVWGTEISLYYPDLYAGTTDCVGVFKNAPAIIDFKNSIRNKKEEYIEDYKYQLAAYSLAHNEMYKTAINKGVIMIATRDLNYQQFIIEGKEFSSAIDGWQRRLEMYYKDK